MIPIIITSINKPTKAVKEFSKVKGHTVIVVGDEKSPSSYKCKNTFFISIKDQDTRYVRLSKLIAKNHYARKNFGYLYAIEKYKPEFIYESDDDNIPYRFFPNFIFKPNKITEIKGKKYFNIYSLFTKKNVWPRGIPLTSLLSKSKLSLNKVINFPLIQQSLADLDPDVDAIYRLTIYDQIRFDKNKSFILSKGLFSPFNSQNTLWHKKVFSLLYLPHTCSDRATDIWRGYIAQKILWELKSCLAYFSPSVYQIRNPHNYLNDFRKETDVYLRTEELLNILSKIKLKGSIDEMMIHIYKELIEHNFFEVKELLSLKQWLEEIKKI